jgi:hypothetical protein
VIARWTSYLIFLLICLHALACGGSGSSAHVASRGRVTLTISWPPSRAIPTETRSLRIVVKVLEPENGPEVADEVIQRPEGQSTTQITLEDLPSVRVRITARAFVSQDGSGEPIAEGSAEVSVTENSSVGANITLAAQDEGCPVPEAFAEAQAFTTGPELKSIGIQTATAGPSNGEKVVRDSEFQEQTVTTSAMATVVGRSSTHKLLRGAETQASFKEWLMISAPGRQGELATATVTMTAVTPTGSAGVDKTLGYHFWVEYRGRGLDDSTFRISGGRGSQDSGDPPPQGNVSGTVQFRYGEPFLLDIGAAFTWNDNTFPGSSTLTASWNFVSMQLPEGASFVPARNCPVD